jgi:hypothetical protein
MKKLILLWIIVLLTVACGRKGPPVPWESIVPRRIVDLGAVSREGRLLLEWTAPKENTNKSTLTDLDSFQVFRSEGDLVGGECKGCGEGPKIVHEMKLSGKEDVRGKKMSVLFEDLRARKVYTFEVVSMNQRGYPSVPSNPVQVYWDDPPQQPGGVKAERGDKRVDLSWEPVAGATGYNVYRRTGDTSLPPNPLNTEPLAVTHHTDLSAQNDITYLYSVRAVKRVVKTDVEGKGSVEVSITPTKLTPPGSPVGLVAIPLKHGIELNWRKNQEPDLLGYNVYRRKIGRGELTKLTKDPLPKETFLDTDVELGQDYDYAVTAVDRSPNRNESPFSEEVRIRYIY